MSDGRAVTSSSAMPAAMAPELTRTTECPARRAAASCSQRRRTAPRSTPPVPPAIDDEPILTTARTGATAVTRARRGPARSRQDPLVGPLQLDGADAHDVALARARAGERTVDAHALEAVLHVVH